MKTTSSPLALRGTLRRNALGLTVSGIAFCLFFQQSKHRPALAAVNPFSEDPYDSVASFAVQLVLFLILLSLIRAFRSSSDPGSPSSLISQIRGQFMAHIAIAFTLVADLIAMARHPSLWIATAAGHQLLAITLCLLLWSAASAALLLLSTPALAATLHRFSWIKLLAVPAIALLVLATYPERLRQTLTGEIFTVLCGLALLFAVVWAVGTAWPPAASEESADLFDDLASIGSFLAEKLRIRRAPTAGKSRPSVSTRLFGWLNPRRHRWNIVFAVGILFGTFLVVQELAEGDSPHGARRLLVIAVYLGLETAGVLTGYALLADPLSLFRRD
jgi:hypothetical protein